jgi:GPI mannosyltransferase 4
MSNIILALLFGTLHQAGVVPSLCHLHEVITADLAKNETVQVVYWKTYMPPRRFLGIPQARTLISHQYLIEFQSKKNLDVQNGRLSIIDLGGAPSSELLSVLSSPPSYLDNYLDPNFKVVTYPSQHSITKTYIVAPLHSRVQLPCCSTLRRSFFPHLDLDHIGESMEAGWYGLGLGLFRWEDEHR